jgi:hypothetical protein
LPIMLAQVENTHPCLLALFVAQTFRYVLNSEAFWTICNLWSNQLCHSQQGINRTSMASSFSRGDRHDECTLFRVGSVDFCWTHVHLLPPPPCHKLMRYVRQPRSGDNHWFSLLKMEDWSILGCPPSYIKT